jgi:hypothetical protein
MRQEKLKISEETLSSEQNTKNFMSMHLQNFQELETHFLPNKISYAVNYFIFITEPLTITDIEI